MAGTPDSGQLDLSEVFRRVQTEMLAQLSVGGMIEHAATQGSATERQWIELFANYLPKAYRASPAFVVNAEGQRSHQIDIAIYDQLYSPPLFPHASGIHIPVESVYAVFEVKAQLGGSELRYAGEKVASVRNLYPRRENKILAGILATSSDWKADTFSTHLRRELGKIPLLQRLDLGCVLARGSFEHDRKLHISHADEALIFFVLRLIERLNGLGPAAPANLMRYGAKLSSFRGRR